MGDEEAPVLLCACWLRACSVSSWGCADITFCPLPLRRRRPSPAQDDKAGGGDAEQQQQFDAFLGADAGVFAGGEYDEDDREADRVWEQVDAHMDERRRVSVWLGDWETARLRLRLRA